MKLSIVIIGKNEAENLPHCFSAIQKAHIPTPFETIYIDSDSTDQSLSIARSYGAITLSITSPTPAKARNTGWKAAQAPLILFLDADTCLHPDFLTHALPYFSNPTLAALDGTLSEINLTNFYHRVFNIDWQRDPGPTPWCAGNALYRRSALEAVGSFKDSLRAGEEPELGFRLRQKGYKLLHIAHPIGTHNLNMSTFKAYFTRCIRTGFAYAELPHCFPHQSRHNFLKTALLPLFPLFFLIKAIRLKQYDPITRCSYALHCQIQHLPIFIGQLLYWLRKDTL